ncbi:MAG: non-canonical purine NTP pyrophosphatase [Microgenomates group bacterium]|nr:non-canonical purine NTP pyrophosphatase [Microgenomates group bacterium]
MKKLLIATHNQDKLKELTKEIKKLTKNKLKIYNLNDLGIKIAPEETGKTFEENAKIKAKFYGDLTGMLTLADDGGLIIPYLKNEPGVKSRRWPGYEADDQELIDFTLAQLRELKKNQRCAFLQTCVCLYNPLTKKFFCRQEKIKGYIAEKSSGKPTQGYPFRSLFVVDGLNKYYDSLTKKEHQNINHRLKAIKKLNPLQLIN